MTLEVLIQTTESQSQLGDPGEPPKAEPTETE